MSSGQKTWGIQGLSRNISGRDRFASLDMQPNWQAAHFAYPSRQELWAQPYRRRIGTTDFFR
jgi:hypothetical protein